MTRFLREIQNVKLVSFDVFDTVIARRCGAPEMIFRIVGEKLRTQGVLDVGGQEFDRIRVDAESRCRFHSAPVEVTLAGIYQEMNSFWRLPRLELDKCITCELETEQEQLFLIPGALKMVRDVVDVGKRVAFTSDMYLPDEFLRSILAGFGLMRSEDALYVSSRWGETKANGGLYQVLLDTEGLLPGEVLHVGDSLKVDFQQARKQGISALHFPRGALNRFETALSHCEKRASGVTPDLAGTARIARLAADGLGEQQVAARLGASIAGPLLTQYAEWVLGVANRRGLEKLYFLARDGEALLRLCEILAPSRGAEKMELKYLHGSRQVWYPAALLPMNEGAADFFARNVAFASESWQECAEFLGLSPETLEKTGFGRRWSHWAPSLESKRSLFVELTVDAKLRPVIKSWLEQKTEATRRYLRESGLIGPQRVGLVDCGWSGTWTKVLCDLVQEAGGQTPEVYFLGRRKSTNAPQPQTFSFLFDQHAGTGLDRIPDFLHVVVEFFLTASHGRTLGFKEDGRNLVPVLAAVDLQGFTAREWKVFRDAVLGFARLYVDRTGNLETQTDLRAALLEPIRLLWEQPSTGEAAFFGKHTVALSPAVSSGRELARPYTPLDAWALAFRFRLPGYSPFWWHPGALALTRLPLRLWMQGLWQVRELVRNLRDAKRSRCNKRDVIRLCIASCRATSYVWQIPEEADYWDLLRDASHEPRVKPPLAVAARVSTH